jgi:hypothetical protein
MQGVYVEEPPLALQGARWPTLRLVLGVPDLGPIHLALVHHVSGWWAL